MLHLRSLGGYESHKTIVHETISTTYCSGNTILYVQGFSMFDFHISREYHCFASLVVRELHLVYIATVFLMFVLVVLLFAIHRGANDG